MSRFPVSRVCPQCGGKEYTLRKPEQLVAFAYDRVCEACQTRYAPPTQVWAAIVFILVGMFGVVLGIVFIVVPPMLPGMVLVDFFKFGFVGCSCAIFGAACVVHGIRSLTKSWK